jgi:hypothetical protein
MLGKCNSFGSAKAAEMFFMGAFCCFSKKCPFSMEWVCSAKTYKQKNLHVTTHILHTKLQNTTMTRSNSPRADGRQITTSHTIAAHQTMPCDAYFYITALDFFVSGEFLFLVHILLFTS